MFTVLGMLSSDDDIVYQHINILFNEWINMSRNEKPLSSSSSSIFMNIDTHLLIITDDRITIKDDKELINKKDYDMDIDGTTMKTNINTTTTSELSSYSFSNDYDTRTNTKMYSYKGENILGFITFRLNNTDDHKKKSSFLSPELSSIIIHISQCLVKKDKRRMYIGTTMIHALMKHYSNDDNMKKEASSLSSSSRVITVNVRLKQEIIQFFLSTGFKLLTKNAQNKYNTLIKTIKTNEEEQQNKHKFEDILKANLDHSLFTETNSHLKMYIIIK